MIRKIIVRGGEGRTGLSFLFLILFSIAISTVGGGGGAGITTGVVDEVVIDEPFKLKTDAGSSNVNPHSSIPIDRNFEVNDSGDGGGSSPEGPTVPENSNGDGESIKIEKPLEGESAQTPALKHPLSPSTELTTDPLKNLMIISTMDGTLTALDRVSGEFRWVSKDAQPMIQVPLQQSAPPSPPAKPRKNPTEDRSHPNQKAPYFLPDPKTGSLYMMGKQNSLRKLPFTIPQLVSMAPCRNSEGLMYTGRKHDSWLILNPYTGEKHPLPLDFSQPDATCPASPTSDYCTDQPENTRYSTTSSKYPKSKSLLIGKTEYTLSMMDGPRQWNVSYNHYSSLEMTPQSVQDYNLVHFTSPSEGHVVTYDRTSGNLLWQLTTLPSPVMALYLIDSHSSNLISIPFNPIATETLTRLREGDTSTSSSQKALSPTTYVGECAFGLYAVPTLADDKVLVIGEGSQLPPLLEGPEKESENDGKTPDSNSEEAEDGSETNKNKNKSEKDFLLLGYYQVNEATSTTPQPGITAATGGAGSTQMAPDPTIPSPTIPTLINRTGSGAEDNPDTFFKDKVIMVDEGGSAKVHQIPPKLQQEPERTHVQFPPPKPSQNSKTTQTGDSETINNNNSPADPLQHNHPPAKKNIRKEVKLVVTSSVISIVVTSSVLGAIFVAYRRYKNNQLFETQRLLSGESSGGGLFGRLGGSLGGDVSNGSNSGERVSGSGRLVASILPDGTQDMTIGKINFNQSQVLGKGCEGTFVFKGKFEGRDVAVKRILPECFAFADREVDLLKESDQHVNVIRYFCTETDGQFRYIALELCVATLSDWVEGKYVNEKLDPARVLREATEGLGYLHSLRIVHRDVKPANVLLSENGRTLISDFGLCKKIQSGRASYSRRSGGVPGTDGWIAPEVIQAIYGEMHQLQEGETSCSKRMTYAVDIFSMGCVFYYVLSKGHHPFGSDAFRRQSNILSGDYDLSKISEDPRGVAVELIRMMISMDPNERPPLRAVLRHPIFWDNEKVLNFFLDVSDRIEKETEESFPLLRKFEEGGKEEDVVRGDWRDHICQWVAMDLRRYRTYKGGSVRDLLRALRNKKNHYRELEKDAQVSLGGIPDGFVGYWVGRFPKLLGYTWAVFESLKGDEVFARYYDAEFDFYYTGENYGMEGESAGLGLDMGEDPSKSLSAVLGKDFWRSKSQVKYQKWKLGNRRGGNNNGRGSPRRFREGEQNQQQRNNSPHHQPRNDTELSASTDNYWRGRGGNNDSPILNQFNEGRTREGSRSPGRSVLTKRNTNQQQRKNGEEE